MGLSTLEPSAGAGRPAFRAVDCGRAPLMEPCCNPGIVPDRQRHVLSVVLVINLAMFLIELGAGLRARSSALLADSADMLGDAVVYGFSLYIVGRGSIWQARGALLIARTI